MSDTRGRVDEPGRGKLIFSEMLKAVWRELDEKAFICLITSYERSVQLIRQGEHEISALEVIDPPVDVVSHVAGDEQIEFGEVMEVRIVPLDFRFT